MKVSSILNFGLLAFGAVASPIEKRQYTLSDADILQFALTLEHLEDAFYKQALLALPESAFTAAGYNAGFYSTIRQISFDEQTHVAALTAGLKSAGANPVTACKYNFQISTVRDFLTLSAILEGVGTSAYLGAAPAITSKSYLTIAGSILAVEALHTSQQRAAINRAPEANPFYTPITANGAYTLAAAFITSCPSTNVKLPFTAFPTVTTTATGVVARGSTVQLTLPSAPPAGSYATWVSGLDIVSVALGGSGTARSAVVPPQAAGQAYVFITNANVTTITDSNVVAGPAIVGVEAVVANIDFSTS